MHNPAIWNKRWQALAEIFDEMCAVYKNPTFLAVATCLKVFGKDQFEFFHTGFENGRLLPSPDFPPENILRATLDQVSYDITAIQQIVAQRSSNFPKMGKALTTADGLAQNALNLAIDSKLVKQAAVVTYFLKAPNIRVIPYAPAAMVGVPYTCLKVFRDYLATPHEVGHYVYHHGESIKSDLLNLLPVMPDWGAGWLEEIFADVYGCLVAGPVIGLDFEDLLADNDLESFITSDGEHPVDAVRPYSYIKVLKELTGYAGVVKVLEDHWQAILDKRGDPQSFFPDDEFGEVPMSVAKDFVEETAVTILNYLIKRGVPTDKAWTNQNTNPDKLYETFAQEVDTLAQTRLNTLQADTDEDKLFVVLPDGEKRNQRKIGDTQIWIDWAKEQSRAHDKEPLPASVWIGIFNAGGWPVKGPEGNTDGGG